MTTPVAARLLLVIAVPLVIMPMPAQAQGNAQSAPYRVTFEGKWTTSVTTGGLPSGAHFSPLIGAVHNGSVTFWSSGGTASAGVEAVAELGATATFKSEINAGSNALAVIEKSLPSGGTPAATVDFTVTTAHPLVTLLSMIAPSPDWFVGVSGLSLRNAADDGWQPSLTVDLFPYDAGTEDGTEFSLNNAATSPQGTITSIKGTGKFSNQPIATLTFDLLAAPVITTTLPILVPENETAVATLTASDDDTPIDQLTWTIPSGPDGGPDADHFTLSEAGSATFAVDTLAPTLTTTAGATVNGASLTLTFNETLGAAKVATSAFTVTGATTRSVTGVSVRGATVQLTLNVPVLHGESGIEVDYAPPTGETIVDAVGNQAASITDRSVTNNTPATTLTYSVSSPDGSLVVEVESQDGGLTYSVTRNAAALIVDSAVSIKNSVDHTVTGNSNSSHDTTWTPTWGLFSSIRDYHNRLTLDLDVDGIDFALIFQVYNDGLGFRFSAAEQTDLTGTVVNFDVEYNMKGGYLGHWPRGESSPEGPHDLESLPRDPSAPMVVNTVTDGFFALLESDLYPAENFESHVLFKRVAGKPAVTSFMDSEPIASASSFITPWRVVLVGDTPGDLLESTVPVNLASPLELLDTSWIKPGKGLFNWRTLGYQAADGFTYEVTTDTVKRLIDFVAEEGLDYVGVDDGWWTNITNGQIVSQAVDFDINTVMSYAASKNVDMVVYIDVRPNRNKVRNTTDEEIFALIDSLGAKGVKWDYRGPDVPFTRESLRSTARKEMVINFHARPVRLTGARRTIPNAISRQPGWGQQDGRKAFEPTDYLEMAMINALLGPFDMINGIYDIDEMPDRTVGANNPINSTVASENARAFTIFSGMVMLPDTPEEYRKKADMFEFLKEMPTTWDDTRVLHSSLPNYISTARRSGSAWFVCSVTNESARTLTIPLDFLSTGISYDVTYYEDDHDGENPTHYIDNRETYQVRTGTVSSTDTVDAIMVAGGGHCMWIRRQPVTLLLTPASIGENGGVSTVTATLPEAVSEEIVVTVSAAALSPAVAADFMLSSSTTLTIATGATTSTGAVTITAVDNSVDAPNKEVMVSGSLTSGGLTDPDDVTLTITDDDDPPTVMLRLSRTSIDENGGVSTVTARLDRESSETTTVTVSATAVSPAVAGDFRLSTNKTLTITAGQTTSTGTVTITANDNDVDTVNKTVRVSGSLTSGGLTDPDDVTLSITDDDDAPQLTLEVGPSAIAEDGGVSTVTVESVNGVAFAEDQEISLSFAGTAAKGTDYTVALERLTLTAGQRSVETTVTAVDEAIDDDAETILVTARHGGGTIGAERTITITDDDDAPVIQTASPILVDENKTAVATLAATDADRPAEDLRWRITGGADRNRFRLTADGVLTFAAAEDYERPGDSDGNGDYEVTVEVSDGANPVEAVLTVRLEDVDDTAPMLSSASVNGNTLTLTYGETLDGSSRPGSGDFTVAGGNSARTVSNVGVSGRAVTLTLNPAVEHGETGIRVSYRPGTNPIQDAAGNDALGLSNEPVTNNTGDTTSPTVSRVQITSRPERNATYGAGKEIQVTVTFSENVVVTQTPQLTLNVGGGNRTADYQSGVDATLLFSYTVADGESDADGVSIEANRLTLNGGTIRDGSNNNAVLDHEEVAADSGHKVDGVKPQLAASGGEVVNGTTLTLTYDEPLDGSSTPATGDFTVSGGDQMRTVTGVRVNGSAVELTLDVGAEHEEAGIQVSYTPGDNPIQDVLGNDAERLSRLPVTNDTPDTTSPTVSSLAITSNPGSDQTYAEGDEIEVTVRFDETVEVTGTPQLSLRVGTRTRTAGYLSGTGTAALVFAYEVADGDEDTGGVSIEANRLTLNGGTIRDGSNNNAVLDHKEVAADSGHKVDGVKPQLAATGGAVVNGTTLTLTYDEPLGGSSTPEAGDFTVTGGDRARTVTRVTVSGSTVVLTLDTAAEHLEAGILVSYTPGTNKIRDVAGNQAETLSQVRVTNETPDTTPPEVESLAVSSNPGSDQTYAEGDEIEVTVTFNETVQVEGTPQLRLRVGTRTRTAGYDSGTGTAALVFAYEVADGDEDTGGVSIEAGRITLNRGTIEDEAENAAELDHEALATQAEHQVDGVRPAFVSAAVDGASLTLTYGEGLDGGSRPASGDFTVEVGGSGRSVSGVSISDAVVTLTLNPVVEHGDTGIRVSYTPDTNPIRDAVGNDALGLSNRSVTNTTGAPNTDPQITSPSSFEVPENQAMVRRLAARDTDPGDEVTGWEIVGGVDQSEFSITSDTGDLSFRTAPDFEAPGDNQYEVTVEVKSGAGARELEAEQTFTISVTDEREPPDVPEVPAISGETADSLTVSWSEPDNTGPAITDYDVQYREKGTGRFIDGDHEGPGRTLTLEDLEPGTVYEVRVRAANDEGTSGWSDPGEGMTVTPLTVVMASGTDPPVSGPFRVRFSFSEPVTGFSASDIETGQDPACVDDQNNTVFCDPGIGGLETADDRVFTATVTPQTDPVAHSYTLRLTVPGGAVRSSVGSKPNEETEEPLEVRVSPPGAPEAISSLGLTAGSGNGTVRLSWNRPSDNGGSAIIRYEVRNQAVGEAWSEWEKVGAGSRGVTVGNLVNGREYVFEVRAVNALGKGGAETVQATPERRIAPPPPPRGGGGGGGGGGGLLFPPEAPLGLMAMPGDGAVRLEWGPPESDGGTPILRYEYRLKEGRGAFGEWTRIEDSAPGEVNASGYTVEGLGKGTVYVFELRAVNLVGGGPVSEAVEAVMGLDRAYWSNFLAGDLQGIEVSLEEGPLGGSPQSVRLRFGAGLRFEESELDGEGEVTGTRMGGYGYRYTSRTTGDLRLDYDGGKSCELRLTFSGVGAGSYSYRCGGVLGGQGSFRMSGLNRGPEITSLGPFEVAENTARVGRVEAVDGDDEIGGYGIAGGADGALFAVEAGELMFREAPDYETPGDVASDDPQSGAADNEYIVVVEVRSGEGERERRGIRAIRVRVSDEEEPPEITSPGPFEVVENRTRVGQLEAVDQDKQDEITEYGVAGGADGALFAVVEETGELLFREAPDYEDPSDVESAEPASGAADNEYIVVVEVRSGEGERERRGRRAIRVRVSDEEEPPEITSLGPFEVVENRTRVGQLEAVDQDKQDEITEYGVAGGADGELFAVVEETGELMFREAPDYEDPSDVESAEPASGAGDNEYIVVVEVRSGEGERERRGRRAIRVRVSDEEEPPEITSLGPFEVVENRTRVGQLEAVDQDKQDEITEYGIAGGADGGLFEVVEETGELMFREAPDYEDPSDVESEEPQSGAADNEYIVVVEVRSGEGERERRGSRAIRVRVGDEEEPPGAPGAPVVTAEGSDSLKVSWREPENRGPEIVDYEVRYREGGEAGYSDGGHEGRGLEVRLSGLEEWTVYEVQVRAVNQEGMSEWSEPGEGRTGMEEADPEEADPEDPSDFTEGDLEGERLTLRLEGEEGSARSLELRFGEGNRFEQIESVGEQAATRTEGVSRSGAYTYEKTGPHMGTVSLTYDDGASCEIRLSFTGTGVGAFAYDCGGGDAAEGSFRLTTGSLFVPVILSSAGQNQSFFTSELTLTNRGDQDVKLDYSYSANRGEGSGTASEVIEAGRQKIKTDALGYLRGLGMPIPETGNRIGTLRVEVRLGSEVEAVVRTTTVVPEGRAGLAYLGVAEEEGFEEAVYLCGLRQNGRDRSNVAFQNMGAPEEGAITVRTTVYSGEAADATARVLKDVTLEPGGFHQYSGLLGVLGVPAQGYVKVERVEGTASFYAYGVINDQANSDGSFVFPVTASSLEGKPGQTLPVIVETSEFTSELTVTNFSEEPRTLDFQFVSEQVKTDGKTAGFSMTLEAGRQQIIPDVVEELRGQVAGLGSSRGFYAGPLFVVAEEGDMSGIVIGARTGSPGGGGSYSVFYNAVPFGEAFSREAWVDGLQQNQENRSNLALVNTGEVDESPSVFHLEIYDGETGLLAETVVTKPIPARGWHQINGILGSYAPETGQGYIRIEKVSGENPFLAYGVVNDGGAPGERSGDGAYLPAQQ